MNNLQKHSLVTDHKTHHMNCLRQDLSVVKIQTKQEKGNTVLESKKNRKTLTFYLIHMELHINYMYRSGQLGALTCKSLETSTSLMVVREERYRSAPRVASGNTACCNTVSVRSMSESSLIICLATIFTRLGFAIHFTLLWRTDRFVRRLPGAVDCGKWKPCVFERTVEIGGWRGRISETGAHGTR